MIKPRNFELRLLLPLALIALATWIFMEVAEEVAGGQAHVIDQAVLQLLRRGSGLGTPIGPAWLPDAMRDITALGSISVLTLTVSAVVGFMLIAGRGAMALMVAAASLGGWGVSTLLKHFFGRARPALEFHAALADGYSFPSGHAMMSAVVYLTLAALAARLTHITVLRLYLIAVAALVAGAVGMSRIYLGVHWASDVVAGWAAGAAWALACWLLARALGLGSDR